MHRLEGFIALVALVTDRSVVAEARGAVFLTLTARLQPAAQ